MRIKVGKRIQPPAHVFAIVDIFQQANVQLSEEFVAVLECARHVCEEKRQSAESSKDLNIDFL
jgi:hypothetical protein